METLTQHIDKEKNEELVDAVRFMIVDNMFDKEFILTAILEYLENNNKREKE